jgi:predicted nuclease with TOPRIM domain
VVINIQADGVMTLAPIEQDEIEKILDEHEGKIEKIDEKVQRLEIDFGRVDERLKNVESSQIEIKNLILQNSNQNLTLLTQVLTSQNDKDTNTQKELTKIYTAIIESGSKKDANKTNLIVKIIAAITALSSVFFAGKNL